MKKVLVTGAGGFIGSHILQKFFDSGYDVYGCDIFATEQFGIKVQQIDMSSQECVEELLREIEPEIIIHCAGSADVGKSVKNPYGDYQGNVTLTHNLLFALHKLGMESVRILMLSSAAVYGNPSSLPITEESMLNPISPYALHKVMGEQICDYFVKNYDMDIRIARIFSCYGVGLKKQIFWDMYRKIEDTGCLNMFGTGAESRDYIYIDDVSEALYLIALAPKQEHSVFNVANGEEITIREATESFARCAAIELGKISFNGVGQEGNPINWCADISRLKAIGYKKQTEMQAGLQKYYNWVSEL